MFVLFTPTALAYYSEPTTFSDEVVYQISQPPQIPIGGIGNGYCTDLVRSYRDIPFRGNAKTWYGQAIELGYETGHEPKEGAILVETGGRYGHVAYVLSVGLDQFTVIEQNVKGKGVVSERTLPIKENLHFIY